MSDRERPEGAELEQETRKIRVTDKRGQAREDKPAPPPSASGGEDESARLAEERLDQLMRLKADFENYRTRMIREQTDLVERASLRIVERLIPVLDDLERALDAARAHDGGDAITRGVELVLRQLNEVLVEEGLERVRAEGAFDPQDHEAVSSAPGAVSEPTVLEVVRPGYKLKGRTIRPALVHVSVPDRESGEGGE